MARINQAMEDLLRYNAAILPQKRSTFDKSHSHTTTGDSAYIIPLDWDLVVPGDEKQIRYSGLARMATPIHPVMDTAYFDVACFFVPYRLVWEHAREFFGENRDASFNPDGEYIMPYLVPSQYGVDDKRGGGIHSLNDYFGFPVIQNDSSDSLVEGLDEYPEFRATGLLHRAYHLIYDFYYRNSSIQPSERLSTGDNITDEEWNVIKHIKKANKFPDYFTSLLREPQAGDDVLLPLGDKAPVVTGDVHLSYKDLTVGETFVSNNNVFSNNLAYNHLIAWGNPDNGFPYGDLGVDNVNIDNVTRGDTIVAPSNLWADLTSATAATVNNLRAAITIQQLLEIDGMAGKRYQQILQAHFGVFTPDATLQQPELLGLTRTTVGMRQVLQTSSTDSTSPQGNTAAFSLTNITNEWICNKSFTEPGIIMTLGVIRTINSYSQGLSPLLQKLNRYDHYWPVFDNLGNQPVYSRTLDMSSSSIHRATLRNRLSEIREQRNQVLGYSEAWTEYRLGVGNRVSGRMRPDIGGTLASWNYTSVFDDTPVLNSAFIEADPNIVDRTIAVTSEPQFIIDSYFDYKDTKSMGVHSVPGLTRL